MKFERAKNPKVVFALIGIILLSLLAFQIGRAMQTATTNYFLETPIPVADYYVSQYSNSSYFAVNGSNWDNFLVDSNASYVINTCLRNLTPGRTWKETVLLTGNITLTAPILVANYTKLVITGELKLANGINTGATAINMIQEYGDYSFAEHVFIEICGGGVINGNRLNQDNNADAVYFDGDGGMGWSVHDLFFKEVRGYAMRLEQLGESYVDNIYCMGGPTDCYGGIAVIGCWDCQFTNLFLCTIGTDSHYALAVTASTTVCSFTNVESGGGQGIAVNGAFLTFSELQMYDHWNGAMKFFDDGSNYARFITVNGGVFADNSQGSDGTYSHIKIYGHAHHIAITGVTFTDDQRSVTDQTCKYAVEEAENADYNSVTCCIATGQATGAWNIIGGNSIQAGNIPSS